MSSLRPDKPRASIPSRLMYSLSNELIPGGGSHRPSPRCPATPSCLDPHGWPVGVRWPARLLDERTVSVLAQLSMTANAVHVGLGHPPHIHGACRTGEADEAPPRRVPVRERVVAHGLVGVRAVCVAGGVGLQEEGSCGVVEAGAQIVQTCVIVHELPLPEDRVPHGAHRVGSRRRGPQRFAGVKDIAVTRSR